jgi:methionine salvage enolase-phosphatase E1
MCSVASRWLDTRNLKAPVPASHIDKLRSSKARIFESSGSQQAQQLVYIAARSEHLRDREQRL